MKKTKKKVIKELLKIVNSKVEFDALEQELIELESKDFKSRLKLLSVC